MDCIDKLLRAYNKTEKASPDETEEKASQIIVKIMNKFQKHNDSEYVKNCLLLLINLFYNEDNPDYIHHQGKKVEDISPEEKSLLIKTLKTEFTPSRK